MLTAHLMDDFHLLISDTVQLQAFPWEVACGQEVGNNSALKQIITTKTQFQLSISLHCASKDGTKTDILRLVYQMKQKEEIIFRFYFYLFYLLAFLF